MLAPHQLHNEEVNPIHLGTIQNALDGHIVLLLDSVGVTYLGQQGTVKQFVQHHWFHCQILGLIILEVWICIESGHFTPLVGLGKIAH